MKRIGQSARDDQIAYMHLLTSQGYRCVTCQGFEAARRAVIEYLG
jgi:hypothetical protein